VETVPTTTEDELIVIQLAIARADLKLKQLELDNRPSPRMALLTNPVLIAAAITACITFSTAYITSVISNAQLMLEEKKFYYSVLSDAMRSNSNTEDVWRTLHFFIDNGFLTIPTGTLRETLLQMEKTHTIPKHN
jgi:hypothetical protein